MSSDKSAARTRRLRLAMVAVLALLLAHNAVLAVRNQLIFDRWHRTQVQLPSLSEITYASKNDNTRKRFGMFYLLRDLIGGSTLELPTPFRSFEWFLARLSQLEIVPGQHIKLDPQRFKALTAKASVVRQFSITLQRDIKLHIVVGDRGERYAFAEKRGGREWLLLPRRYLAAPSLPPT